MKPYYRNDGSRLYQGHVLDALKGLEAGSVQCVVTSPPYWGLRDYGLPPVEWPPVSYAPMAGLAEIEVPGCDPECAHVWGEERVVRERGSFVPFRERDTYGHGGGIKPQTDQGTQRTTGQYCHLCGGWRGCLGLEPSVEMFVGHIVLVARELWRVLRDDGTFWCNMGDSYSSNTKSDNRTPEARSKSSTLGPKRDGLGGGNAAHVAVSFGTHKVQTGLKPKDLIGIPWRVALALQADGWYLRSDIIWAKGVSFCSTYSGSCMPESVRDRPTKGHEYVFLLAKSDRYYYDQEAVRETSGDFQGGGSPIGAGRHDGPSFSGKPTLYERGSGRNLRTVWLINPGSYAGAHFATFPPALVEPMIKAGTSERGCCPSCGAPWERVTSKEFIPQQDVSLEKGIKGSGNQKPMDVSNGWNGFPRGTTAVTTTGWRPTCTCPEQEPDPCTVLDPFLGSGTVAEVATRLRRRWVGIELSRTYCDEHIIPRLSEPIQMELLWV